MMRVVDNHRAKITNLPPDWKERRMKVAVRHYQTEKNTNPNPTVLSLTKFGVRIKTDLSFGKSTENYVGHQVVRQGQFVFTPRDFDATPILCGVSQYDGCISNLYIVFDITHEIYPKFLEYYFYGLKYGCNYFEKLSFGMRYSFNRTQFEAIPLAYPKHATQKAIAEFLDRETTRINQMIEKKQRLVELLEEKISGTIDQAVTTGMDRSVLCKISGIPWLHRTPAHWQVERAKYLYYEAKRPPREEDKVITAFRDGQVTLRENRRTEGFTFAVKEVGYQHINKGDLVIHTMDAFAGAIGVSESDGKSTGEYAVCVARSNRVNNHYYAYLLRCMAKRNYIFVLCPSVRERAPRFRFVRFAPVLLPVPPRDEQDQIVDYIEESTCRLYVLKDKTNESINRLREFSSALITAAVTGQIDVETWGKRDDTDRRLGNIEQGMAS